THPAGAFFDLLWQKVRTALTEASAVNPALDRLANSPVGQFVPVCPVVSCPYYPAQRNLILPSFSRKWRDYVFATQELNGNRKGGAGTCGCPASLWVTHWAKQLNPG